MKDELAVLQAARGLDQEALVAIFDVYAPAIYRYAFLFSLDSKESDNIVGDTFSGLLEQIAVGKGPQNNLRAYLFQTAYPLLANQVHQRQPFVHLQTVMEVPGRLVAVSRETKFDEGAFMKELANAINNELDELQKQVIVLRFVEGFSLKETASIIRRKVNHVKVIQNRGIARLRKCLHL